MCLFNISSGQDFKDSNAVIAQADQGGLGLPERDYYFRDDAHTVATRKEYVAHMTRMLKLMGVPEAQAAQQAEDVMKLETAMAKASADVTSRRDPAAVYHMMTLRKFEALSDSFAWSRYFAALKGPKMDNDQRGVAGFLQGAGSAAEERAAWRSGRPI